MSSRLTNRLAGCVRRSLPLLLVPGLALLAFVCSVVAHHNFYVVSPGLVYRSAQMNAGALSVVIPEYGIKSILNLRGAGEGKDWYSAEINTSRQFGVQHFDYALSASHELKDEEMDQILATIRNAPKPILIHCKSGSDRTGLVWRTLSLRIGRQAAGNGPAPIGGVLRVRCRTCFGAKPLPWTTPSGGM